MLSSSAGSGPIGSLVFRGAGGSTFSPSPLKKEKSRAPPPPSLIPPPFRPGGGLSERSSPPPSRRQRGAKAPAAWCGQSFRESWSGSGIRWMGSGRPWTLDPCCCSLDRCRDVSRRSISVLKHFSPTGGRRKRKLKEAESDSESGGNHGPASNAAFRSLLPWTLLTSTVTCPVLETPVGVLEGGLRPISPARLGHVTLGGGASLSG